VGRERRARVIQDEVSGWSTAGDSARQCGPENQGRAAPTVGTRHARAEAMVRWFGNDGGTRMVGGEERNE
jgi:hypothetical protein